MAARPKKGKKSKTTKSKKKKAKTLTLRKEPIKAALRYSRGK